MRTRSRGFHINSQTFGDGPGVLLISGLLQAGQDWIDTGYIELLSLSHRVVAVDPLGFGKSDKPHDVDAYDLDGQVTDMIAVLDEVGIEEAVVWGYSMGCVLATALATQHSDRTAALVVGGNLAALTPHDRDNIFTPGATVLEEQGVTGFIDQNMPYVDEPTRQLFTDRNDALAAAAAVRSMARPHAAEDLPLPERTFNYVGTREPWYDVAVAVAESIGVEFEGVPDADHSGAFRAVNLVVPMVLSFVKGTSLPTS